MIAQNGPPVNRGVAQMDLDSLVMPMARHIAAPAVQPGEAPGVEIAVNQRHDGDAEIGHDEAGLLRRRR